MTETVWIFLIVENSLSRIVSEGDLFRGWTKLL